MQLNSTKALRRFTAATEAVASSLHNAMGLTGLQKLTLDRGCFGGGSLEATY